MSDEAQANVCRTLVREIKTRGALAFAQMVHAGAISQAIADTTAGPSPSPAEGRTDDVLSRQRPLRSAGRDDGGAIADAVNGFAGSAARAIEVAGFDAIESRAPTDIVSTSFLTDHANNRADVMRSGFGIAAMCGK